MNALREFGAPLGDVAASDFAQPGITFQIGIAPNRIDIATAIDGVTFDEAWERRVESTYGDHRIGVIGRDDLIANKTASGRPQDVLDIGLLTKHGPSPT